MASSESPLGDSLGSTSAVVSGLEVPYLTKVSELTEPRGVHLRDELSGRPASMLLKIEGLRLHYSTKASAALDYATVRLIAPMMAQIVAEETATGSSVERAWHAAEARALTVAMSERLRSLVCLRVRLQEFDTANAGAIRLLRAIITLYGEGAIETLRVYALLAETALGLGPDRHASCESYLFAATSVLLREERNGGPRLDALRCVLLLVEGRLNIDRRRLPEARAALAKAVVLASAAQGPEGISVAAPLFHLGRCLHAEGNTTAAMSTWEKAVDAVAGHVLSVRPPLMDATKWVPHPPSHAEDVLAGPPPLGVLYEDIAFVLTEALAHIGAARVALLGAETVPVADVRATRARVFALVNQNSAGLAELQPAIKIFVDTLVSGGQGEELTLTLKIKMRVRLKMKMRVRLTNDPPTPPRLSGLGTPLKPFGARAQRCPHSPSSRRSVM